MPTEKKPIITTDRRKVQAYNDSLNLYNKAQKNLKIFKEFGDKNDLMFVNNKPSKDYLPFEHKTIAPINRTGFVYNFDTKNPNGQVNVVKKDGTYNSKIYNEASGLQRKLGSPESKIIPIYKKPEQPYILKKEKKKIKKIKKDIVPVPVKESIPKDTIPIIEPVVKPQVEKEPEPIVPKKLPGGSGPFARYPNMKGQLGNVKTSRMVNAKKVENIVPTFVSGAKSVKQYRGDENLPEAKNGMKKDCGCKHSKSKYKYASGTKSAFIPFPQMQPFQQGQYRMGMQKDADFTVTNIGRYAKPTKAQKELSARMDAKYKAEAKKRKVHQQQTPVQSKPAPAKTTPVTLPPPVQVIPTAPVVTPVVPPITPPVVTKPNKESWTETQWQDFLKEKNNVPYVKPTPYIPVAKKQVIAPIVPSKPKNKPINAKFLDPNSKGVLMSQQGKILPKPKLTSLKDFIYNFPKDKTRKVAQVPVKTEVEEPSILDSVLEDINGLISGGQRLIQKTQSEKEESINRTKIVDEDTIPSKTNIKVDSLPVNYGYKQFKTYPDPHSNNPTDSLVSFRNVFDNDSGAEYVIGHKINEVTKAGARKKFNNVKGVAHFLRDSDLLPNQKIAPKNWVTTKGDKYETTSPGKTVSAPDLQDMNRYRMLYKPIPGTDKYKTKYVKPGSQEALRQLEKEGWQTDFTVSGQHKFSDINWEGKGKKTGYKGLFDETRWVPLKNGEFTHIPYKDKDSFSRFSGGSVTYLFKHPVTEKNIGADFGGSVNDMRDYGNKLIQKYKLKPEDLEVVYHDMGSYSAKPKAKNGTLDYDQWEGYNSYNKGFSGAPLIIPNYKYGTGALTIPEGSAIVTANGGKNKQALMAYKKGNYKLLNKIIDNMPEDNVDKAQTGKKATKIKGTTVTDPTIKEVFQEQSVLGGGEEGYGSELPQDKAEEIYKMSKADLRKKHKGITVAQELARRQAVANKQDTFTFTYNGKEYKGHQDKGYSSGYKEQEMTYPGGPGGGSSSSSNTTKTPPEDEYEEVDTDTIKPNNPAMSAAETSAIGSVLAQGVPRGAKESYLNLNKYNYASQLDRTLRENAVAANAAKETIRDVAGGNAGNFLSNVGNITGKRFDANSGAVTEDTLARQDILNKNVDISNVEATTNRNLKDYYDDIKRQNVNDYNALLVKGGQSFDESFDNYQKMKNENQLKAQELQLLKESNPNYTMVKDPKTGLMKSVYRYKKVNPAGTQTTTGTGSATSTTSSGTATSGRMTMNGVPAPATPTAPSVNSNVAPNTNTFSTQAGNYASGVTNKFSNGPLAKTANYLSQIQEDVMPNDEKFKNFQSRIGRFTKKAGAKKLKTYKRK